ncbi:MAG: hypothetical protein AABM42_10610 [Actinomycetota bacterium]
MERRLSELLRRAGQADRALRDGGQDPEIFMLLLSAQGPAGVRHPGWDRSWPTPTEQDIEDLEELGFMRDQGRGNSVKRVALTVSGREQAKLLDPARPIIHGGSAPSAGQVLTWLVSNEADLSDALREPSKLLDSAGETQMIGPADREALAERIVDLHADGYLAGDLPDFQQADAAARLALSDGLRLTIRAHEQVNQPPAAVAAASSVNFYGPVVANQIAAGSITNFTSIAELLVRADAALDELQGVDEDDRVAAKKLIEVLQGRTAELGADVLSGAGGGLLATVLAQLLGLSP